MRIKFYFYILLHLVCTLEGVGTTVTYIGYSYFSQVALKHVTSCDTEMSRSSQKTWLNGPWVPDAWSVQRQIYVPTWKSIKPRLHQGNMLPGYMLLVLATCCRQQVALSGNMNFVDGNKQRWRQHGATCCHGVNAGSGYRSLPSTKILRGDRGICVWTTCPGSLLVKWKWNVPECDLLITRP